MSYAESIQFYCNGVTMNNSIVKRIDELRKTKGWSKYELAKVMGISTNSVYSWYRMGAMPTLSNVERICEVMNITIEQFFCGVGSYNLNEEESKLLQDWFLLSELERKAIFGVINVFKTLKS